MHLFSPIWIWPSVALLGWSWEWAEFQGWTFLRKRNSETTQMKCSPNVEGRRHPRSELAKLQSRCQLTEQKKQKHNPILSRINHRHGDSLRFVCFGCFDIAAGESAAWEAVVARRQGVFFTNQAGGNTRCWNRRCSLPSQSDWFDWVTHQAPRGRAVLRSTVPPQSRPDGLTELISVSVQFAVFVCGVSCWRASSRVKTVWRITRSQMFSPCFVLFFNLTNLSMKVSCTSSLYISQAWLCKVFIGCRPNASQYDVMNTLCNGRVATKRHV